jgi:hypothetical protein
MGYNIDDIEKIAEFKSWNDRQKINELLRIDCTMYTNLGVDSTKTEKEIAKKNSRKIYRLIKGINYKMGNDFLVAMDR